MTQDQLYCVGDATGASVTKIDATPSGEPALNVDAAPVAIRIFPTDLATKPGAEAKFEVKFLDANGREVKAPADAKVTFTLPQPALPPTAAKGATPPPALNAELKADGAKATLTIAKLPRQQGTLEAKFGELKATARIRVVAQLPYKDDFEKVPVGAAPGGWLNTQGKYFVADKDGNKVLAKVNNDSRPPIARANAYITAPSAANYTIQADLMGTLVAGKLPDMGIVNSRYTLIVDGKPDSANGKRQVRVTSWDAKPRINKAVEFDWQPSVWYSTKLTVEQKEKTAIVKAKFWKKGDAEPADWQITYEDPSPNREGAAAVYGYVSNVTDQAPGSEIFYDNIVITSNK